MIWRLRRKDQIRERGIGWNRWLFISSCVNKSLAEPSYISRPDSWTRLQGAQCRRAHPHQRLTLTRTRNSLKGRVNQWWQCKLNLWILHKNISGFPGDSGGEESVWCGRPRFDPWVGTIPWRREWLPTLILLPGEFCGQRSLADYNPWGHKESDTTEQLTLSLLRVNSQFNRAQSLKVNLGIQEQHPGSILSIRKSRGKGV